MYAPFDAVASIWYLVPEILLISICFGMGMTDFKIRKLVIVPYFIFALLVIQFFLYPGFVARKTMTAAKLEVAKYLRENTSQTIRCTMYDSGIISYFSERDFAGLNGLIGDFEMADMIKNNDLKTLVQRYNISLLVLDMPEEKLDRYYDKILYISKIKTKFMDFQEKEKPFVVYKVNKDNLGDIIKYRYKN